MSDAPLYGGSMEERQRGPAEAPNLGTPAKPRPAASVVLLRRGGKHSDRALEVLLLKRTGDGANSCPASGSSPAAPSIRRTARAMRATRPAPCASWRRRPGSHWPPRRSWCCSRAGSRPRSISRRFDAWFFLALAPAHTPAEARRRRDRRRRLVRAGAGALEAQSAGELALAFPTLKQLESLLPFRTSDEAIAAHRGGAVRADPAQGDRHPRGQPGRPSGRPRLPSLSRLH